MDINRLMIGVRLAALDGFTRIGHPDWLFEKEYQPEQIGTNSAPTVTMFHVGDTPAGQPYRNEFYDFDKDETVREETQLYITRLTIGASTTEIQDDPLAMTVEDMLRKTLYVMQSVTFRETLMNQGISFLRVEQMPNQFAMLDKPGFTAMPTFDIMFQHSDVFREIIPGANRIAIRVFRV